MEVRENLLISVNGPSMALTRRGTRTFTPTASAICSQLRSLGSLWQSGSGARPDTSRRGTISPGAGTTRAKRPPRINRSSKGRRRDRGIRHYGQVSQVLGSCMGLPRTCSTRQIIPFVLRQRERRQSQLQHITPVLMVNQIQIRI